MLDQNQKRKNLGRGLGALLGDDEGVNTDSNSTAAGAGVKSTLPTALIARSRFQPRTEFDAEALDALVQSIKDNGILQPLLVRKLPGDKYELVAGERRLRAAKKLNLAEVPVVIREMGDQESLEIALVENLLREDLSAVEEAEGYQRLMDEFHYTQEVVSMAVGKSRSHVANVLRLLALPENVRKLVKEDKLSPGHARVLIGNPDAAELAQKMIDEEWTVRAAEEFHHKARLKPKKVRRFDPKPSRDEDLGRIEKDLNKSLGLRLKITPNIQGGGKVVLKYASVAELDMILELLNKQKKNSVFKEPDKFTMKVIG